MTVFAESAPELVRLLVCPACRGELTAVTSPPLSENKPEDFLTCAACKLAYPVRDGIPVMLVDEAVPLVNIPVVGAFQS